MSEPLVQITSGSVISYFRLSFGATTALGLDVYCVTHRFPRSLCLLAWTPFEANHVCPQHPFDQPHYYPTLSPAGIHSSLMPNLFPTLRCRQAKPLLRTITRLCLICPVDMDRSSH
ncbi:uncharacterized protein AtWU_07957 [Aspergillus tubingensis]|uniref:uncharacterized protein n=1 Tax=Aspergillus tubingensis TaxID=5068 RepID=UPI001577ECEB|nr:uncharacterized protein AtWU_07957 [Aspergillus tubingensis]GFN18155.1 hypothetical protein AtWU_07957 [Aspergillus tubingensis]